MNDQVSHLFWSKVEVLSDDECWEWLAARDSHGYGSMMSRSIAARPFGAHRIAWALWHGVEIPTGRGNQVLHRCDNPPCVNPYHLYLGDQQANIDDMMERGRWNGGRRPITSNEETVEMRERRSLGESLDDLARDYGVSRSCVSLVCSGKRQPAVGGPRTTGKRSMRRWKKRPLSLNVSDLDAEGR